MVLITSKQSKLKLNDNRSTMKLKLINSSYSTPHLIWNFTVSTNCRIKLYIDNGKRNPALRFPTELLCRIENWDWDSLLRVFKRNGLSALDVFIFLIEFRTLFVVFFIESYKRRKSQDGPSQIISSENQIFYF